MTPTEFEAAGFTKLATRHGLAFWLRESELEVTPDELPTKAPAQRRDPASGHLWESCTVPGCEPCAKRRAQRDEAAHQAFLTTMRSKGL